jgi:putative endonuclease
MNWYVYIVRGADDSLYTGITVDVSRRIIEHNTSNTKGSKSLRGKRPVTIVYTEEYSSRSKATARECEIKHMSRAEKLAIISKPTTQ